MLGIQRLRTSPLVPLSEPHRMGHSHDRPHVDGHVSPGLKEARAEFERNFTRRREIGAAVAAYWRGEKTVDTGARSSKPLRPGLPSFIS